MELMNIEYVRRYLVDKPQEGPCDKRVSVFTREKTKIRSAISKFILDNGPSSVERIRIFLNEEMPLLLVNLSEKTKNRYISILLSHSSNFKYISKKKIWGLDKDEY
jgi:hypothetical protein